MRNSFPVLVVALFVCACAGGSPSGDRAAAHRQPAEREMVSVNLPKTVGPWTRPDAPKRIDETGIFSYMDGAGELYLGYRFDHLDVYEYGAPGRDSILVELYWMRSSDDAFGLLSNDWGGEPIVLQPGGDSDDTSRVPASRALYGAGLLRLWSDTLYARVLATRETPESREQVVALGRAITAGRPVSSRPALLRVLPERPGGQYSIRRDRVWFLRSHLVLNSAYFLASQNILDLSPACEAAIAPYEAGGAAVAPRQGAAKRAQLLVVRYPDGVTAQRALAHFTSAYLPEVRLPASSAGGPIAGAARIERGWVGYRLDGNLLVIALDAPDARAATMLVDAIAH